MSPETVITLGRQGLEMMLIVSAPLLLVALGVGLLVSFFQAITQLNEQTLSFIPKLLAVALTLVLVALIWFQRWPKGLLLPAIALHGYVLSAAVIGWSQGPQIFYGLGLILSQSILLLLALTLLRSLADGLSPQRRAFIGAALVGCGAAWTWSALVP